MSSSALFYQWGLYCLCTRTHHLAPGSGGPHLMLIYCNNINLSTSQGCFSSHLVNTSRVLSLPATVLGVVYSSGQGRQDPCSSGACILFRRDRQNKTNTNKGKIWSITWLCGDFIQSDLICVVGLGRLRRTWNQGMTWPAEIRGKSTKGRRTTTQTLGWGISPRSRRKASVPEREK